MTDRPAILFVCLGNICRSPLAEAAFRKAANDAGLAADADSAGTAAYHVGSPPDPRSIATAARHGIDISDYAGRQIEQADFERFTHIYAMDQSNLRNIRAIAPSDCKAEIALLLDTVPGREGADIADPYYDGEENFAFTWDDVWSAAQAIVSSLQAQGS
ncbi:low molecular weight protein-tyrosine-phosphatase [Pontixanthobacter aquaemixtae]|uniref:protein-tyrosine-phosphatase n=1 Tax=Pontixanthobacter aquaemixtae TaxID=1958940 RepID=A0A844ZTF2_9SPHN|nr:low molecular weight protein-tyrosine-phosphatase [Pontixanthobacter aquaemixtae]MXO90087.1 low molecular weight phosphotyrosine protein phosphatase [Pontixanthobacter aquaemixtae]